MSAEAGPLWGVDELEAVTRGTWLRRPGPAWDPARVRGTAMGNILADWLPDSIIFVTTEKRLQEWFEHEGPRRREPTGCIVVGKKEAKSKYLPRHRAILAVDDTTVALRTLAARARDRMLGGKVLLITGTVGKTTTRGMLTHVLGKRGSLLTNRGNGNFRMHVYAHMASVRPETEFVVFELGLGGPPDSFRDASPVIRADVVLLTQLAIAHLDTITRRRLSERDALLAVAKQKLQLTEQMAPDGVVVVNRDVPIYDDVRAMLKRHNVVTFGLGPDADHRVVRVDKTEEGSRVHADAGGVRLEYDLQLPGTFMAVNSLGALAAAAQVTTDIPANAAALADFEAVPGRARVLKLNLRGVPFTLIDDAYNATPFSVRSSLDLLQEIQPGPGGRRIAVLGDISHLGAVSASTHAGLAEEVLKRNVNLVYTLGKESLHLHRALPPELAAGHFEERDELTNALIADMRPGDVITVKASVPARFDRIVGLLRDLANLAPTQPDPAPVQIASAEAAAQLPAELPAPLRTGDIPRGAWLYSTGEGGPALLTGEDVETLPHGIVEGAWDGDFAERRPEQAEHLFGSGLIGDGDRLIVLAPKHTLEGVFVLEHKATRRLYVSNSLALVCAASGVRPVRSTVEQGFRVGKGFHQLDMRLLDSDEFSLHKLVYYNYELRPDGSVVRLPLPEAREFSSFEDYRAAVSAVVAATAANASHPARRRTYRPLTTISAGYDSAVCAVLAREVGCREAITFRTARLGLVDSGAPVARALGLPVIERDRPAMTESGELATLHPDDLEMAAEFLATGMGGDDVLFSVFEDVLPASLLFTGFHGDKYWDLLFKPSTDAKRGDVSGSSMGEYRARLGYVNLPVPFIFIRSQPSVRAVGRSPAMKPWSVGGAYDRPVPRRIAEEAGVPRKAFGQRKMAASIVFDGIHSPSAKALRILADRYADALGATVPGASGVGV